MWSIGCIFAEMVNGKPPFVGSSEETQLDLIFRHLGTPSEATFPGISELPDWRDTFQQYPAPESLQPLVPTLEPAGVELLADLLTYDPARRISAEEARTHRYFDDLPYGVKKVGQVY
jgi:serine/threonine protein kinase